MPEFPQLKGDLQANKEEKDGAIFYRLIDPSSGREYRLYEIEYLIAIMLDGRTAVDTVAARVRDELKFDLSPNDLERFVRELGSLGFLLSPESGAPSAAAPMELNADDIVDGDGTSGTSVDKMAVEDELDRLIRSALLHIKQGMVSQGRDYFLAAKKYAPSDDKVGTMLNHLDVVGEDDGPSDIEYLWKQAVVLYPGVTQEMGPPGLGSAPIPVDDTRGAAFGRTRKRILWLAASVVIVGGLGFGAWQTFGKELLHPPTPIEVDRVRQQRTHLFYAAEALEIVPKISWPLAFEKKGEVCEVNVKPDAAVLKGAVLARLKLTPDKEKALTAMRQKRQGADKAYLINGDELEALNQQAQQLDKDVEAVKAQLDELQKQLVLKTVVDRAALKKEQGTLGKKQRAVKRDAAALKRKMQGPKQLQVKLKKALEQAQAGEQAMMQKDPWAFLRAPQNGVVQRVDVQINDKADPDKPALVLFDPTELRVKLKSDDARLRDKGKEGTLKLFVGDNTLIEARVIQNDDKGVLLEVIDAEGQLRKRDRRLLRIVRETLESAYVVAATARADETSGYVVSKDVATKRKIEWVEVRGKEAIARGGLQVGEVMVTGPRELLDSKDERVRVQLATPAAEGSQ